MQKIPFTLFTSVNPDKLTKTFRLEDGKLVKESGGNMVEGSVKLCQISELTEFSDVITSLGLNQALCYGVPKHAKVGDEKRLLSERMIASDKNAISRTNANFEWPADSNGILMIDYDPAPGKTPMSQEELVKVLKGTVSELKDLEMLWIPSSSSFIYNSGTDEQLTGLRGQRLYMIIQDPRDIPRVGELIFKRLWLAGHGRIEVGKAGQLLVRSIIDASVYQQSRLDFAAGAYCEAPLEQRRGEPQIISGNLKTLDSKTIRDLSIAEGRRYETLVTAEKIKLKPEAAKVRKTRIEEKVTEHPPEEQEEARIRYTRAYEDGELTGDFVLTVVVHGSEESVTVDDILEAPERYDKLRTLDPVEPAYNHCDDVGMLNLSGDRPNLYSHAHGGKMYLLKSSVEQGPRPPTTRDIYNPYRNTDMGNAERFYELTADDVKHVEELDWLLWNGRTWEADIMGVKELYKQRVVHRIYEEVAEKAVNHEQEGVKELARWGKRSESDSQINSTLRCAASMPGICAKLADFDKNSLLLNVENGTVDLTNGDLLRHDRKNYITKLAPVIYDPSATAPLWLGFLARIFDDNHEMIAFVKKAIGYSLTGSVEGDCWFILHGVGANGKSVFLNCILAMLGSYATQAAPDLLMQARGNSDRHPTELADLMGRRMVVCQESEEGRRLAEASVKRMTTSDRMKARYMGKDFFEFDPTHKLWLATNHVPVIKDTTESTWRRIYLIPFGVVIPPEERDTKLLEKLKEEWPGILNWALEGCLEYQKGGLQPPDRVKFATAEYRQTQDTFAAFLSECCYDDVCAITSSKQLYASFQFWCKESGEYPKSQRLFGQALTERGYRKERKTNGYYYHGIGRIADGEGKVTSEYTKKLQRDYLDKRLSSELVTADNEDVIKLFGY
jgi:putative DNA primase/helicase